MNPIVLVLGSIAAIILLSSRYKLNTFLVLLGLAILVGLLAGIPAGQVLTTIRTGFGSTLEKIGLLIVLGTILGSLLDRTQATQRIADYVLNRLGTNQTSLAVTLIGFLIGLPIFCDSGFVVLSGLILALARRLGRYHLRLVLSLAGALYSVHCLVPPHPGVTAAVAILHVDIGQMMLLGLLLAVPGTVVSYFWAKYADSRYSDQQVTENYLSDTEPDKSARPVLAGPFLAGPFRAGPVPAGALLVILLPILFIAARPLVGMDQRLNNSLILSVISFLGDPIIALSTGVLLACFLFGRFDKTVFNHVVDDAMYKAGPILIIVGAGGAFGEMIRHLNLETSILAWSKSAGSTEHSVPLWLPFLLAVVFKTAQGSSTVAILSVATLLQPLLPGLGVVSDWDRLLVMGAMGAGSMTLSHANDAYFWVVSRFGEVDTNVMLKSYSMMSALMGLTTLLFLWLIQSLV